MLTQPVDLLKQPQGIICGQFKKQLALRDRSVVISHGAKIYDGGTEDLFEKYQKDPMTMAY